MSNESLCSYNVTYKRISITTNKPIVKHYDMIDESTLKQYIDLYCAIAQTELDHIEKL